MTETKLYGGCHCGAVRFTVTLIEDKAINLRECNCSICKKTGFIHFFIEADAFQLLEGENQLTTYTFNTGVAKHYFCRQCGVKSFYVPRSHPDGYSINWRCIDNPPTQVNWQPTFNGAHWEQSIDQLRAES